MLEVQCEKTALDRSHDTDGPPAHTTACTIGLLGGSGFQDGTSPDKDKLERRMDRRRMGLSWKEAEAATLNRQEWRPP